MRNKKNPPTLLGIIANDPDETFALPVIAGIRQVAEERGYTVHMGSGTEYQHNAPDIGTLAGLLVIADAAPDRLLRDYDEAGLPITLISHRVPGLAVPSIMPDNVQGIAKLVEHLALRRERKHLVFIRGEPTHVDAQEREATFRQELIRYNLRVPESHFLRGDFDEAVAANSMRKLIQTGEAFDGVVAADHLMGRAAVNALREAHLAVPEKVSVVAFADDVEAAAIGLTTAAGNVTDLGRFAARQLLGQIKGLRIRGVTKLGVQLIIRET
jgi:LacI family transcriptional regulator